MAFGLSSNHFFCRSWVPCVKMAWSWSLVQQDPAGAGIQESSVIMKSPFRRIANRGLQRFSVAAFLGPCLDENEQLSCFL